MGKEENKQKNKTMVVLPQLNGNVESTLPFLIHECRPRKGTWHANHNRRIGSMWSKKRQMLNETEVINSNHTVIKHVDIL